MQKVLKGLLLLILIFALSACSDRAKENKKDHYNNQTSGSSQSSVNQSSNHSIDLKFNEDEKRDAEEVLRKYLEAKKNNDYNTWESTLWSEVNPNTTLEKEGDLGVLNLTIHKIEFSEKHTSFIHQNYIGTDWATSKNFSEDYLKENFAAVYVEYTVEYDHKKVHYVDGLIKGYGYLLRKDNKSPFLIYDWCYDLNK